MSTGIWMDRWIIGLQDKVEPIDPSHLQYVFVSELIITETNSWNLALLNTLFAPEVVEKIKVMQLSSSEEDVLKWLPSRDGNFTVKSTYNKLTENRTQNQIATSNVPKEIWKALWKIQLPHRVKLFIWKCLKDAVPTRERLSQHNHSIENYCNICNHHNESLFHLLISCTHAKAVWNSLNINIAQVIANCNNVREWIISWFSQVNNSSMEELERWRNTLMVACWIIWKERCDSIFQNKLLNPANTVSRINYQLASFSSMGRTSVISRNDALVVTPSLNHQPSDITTCTIYTDASFDQFTNNCGTGMVLFSGAGETKGFRGSYADRVTDAEAGECMAILEALSWIKATGRNNIKVIADAENVVNSVLSNNSFVRWENRKLIRDIKLLKNSFISCQFYHVKRDSNDLADAIA